MLSIGIIFGEINHFVFFYTRQNYRKTENFPLSCTGYVVVFTFVGWYYPTEYQAFISQSRLPVGKLYIPDSKIVMKRKLSTVGLHKCTCMY